MIDNVVFTKEELVEIEKFCDVLESGKYKQGFYSLEDIINGEYCYCFFGVGIKEFTPDDKVKRKSFLTKNIMSGVSPTDQEYAPAWLKKLSIILVDGNYLMWYNDSRRLSLKSIAGLLRKHVLSPNLPMI